MRAQVRLVARNARTGMLSLRSTVDLGKFVYPITRVTAITPHRLGSNREPTVIACHGVIAPTGSGVVAFLKMTPSGRLAPILYRGPWTDSGLAMFAASRGATWKSSIRVANIGGENAVILVTITTPLGFPDKREILPRAYIMRRGELLYDLLASANELVRLREARAREPDPPSDPLN